MATSLYDEVQRLLVHGLEQTDLFHEATTKGRREAYPVEFVPMLLELVGNHGRALLKIAREVDDLRAAIEGR
jgi:hypothetical protein